MFYLFFVYNLHNKNIWAFSFFMGLVLFSVVPLYYIYSYAFCHGATLLRFKNEYLIGIERILQSQSLREVYHYVIFHLSALKWTNCIYFYVAPVATWIAAQTKFIKMNPVLLIAGLLHSSCNIANEKSPYGYVLTISTSSDLCVHFHYKYETITFTLSGSISF
jgi:hypothetical protein